jgi:uncharacterized SAM-binding protein YcdF (DUF218 family)
METLITNAVAALLMPPGALLLLFLVALLLSWRQPRRARALLLFAVAALYALSVPIVATGLLRLLEPRPSDPLDDRSGQAIVVLGGGNYLDAPEYGGETVNSFTLARLRYGARLQRVLQKPVLVAGGTHRGAATPEALSMKRVLNDEFRVPVQWVEQRSSTTLESARGSFHVLHGAGVKRIYLVTHAWHMPRARYAFEAMGFSVIPAPTLFTTRSPATALDFFPTGEALHASSLFFHEVLGIGWYHLRVAIGR